jgi:hypothetical protein
MQDARAVFFLSEAYRKQVFDKYVPKSLYMELMKKSYIIPNFWFKNKPNLRKSLNFNKEIKLIYAGRIDKNKNIPTIVSSQVKCTDFRHKVHSDHVIDLRCSRR